MKLKGLEPPSFWSGIRRAANCATAPKIVRVRIRNLNISKSDLIVCKRLYCMPSYRFVPIKSRSHCLQVFNFSAENKIIWDNL